MFTKTEIISQARFYSLVLQPMIWRQWIAVSWMSSWVAARGCCGPLTVAVQQGATEQQARGETRRRRRHQGGTPQHSGRRNPSPRWCPLGAGSGVTTTRQGNLPRLKLWLKCLSVSGIALVQLQRINLRLRHFFALNCWNFTFFYTSVLIIHFALF